jgi:hypothetical protein
VRRIAVVLRMVCLAIVFSASPAFAQGALCGSVAQVEHLDPPARLDSELAQGSLARAPTRLSYRVERNRTYIFLAALDQGTPAVTAGHPIDPLVRGERLASDFTAERSGRVTFRLSGPEGARYAAGLWLMDQPTVAMLSIRAQYQVMQEGFGFGTRERATLPGCITLRTARSPVPPPERGRTPRVFLGDDAVIEGGLSPEIIRRVLSRNLAQLRFCFEQGLAARSDLEGRVRIAFVIAPDGVVQSAALRDTTLEDARVEGCIVRALRRMRFPAPDGGGVVSVIHVFGLSLE